MKTYILKEYGSWGVMAFSYAAGALAVGRFNPNVIIAFIALSLYINSKQAFTLWMQSKSPDSARPLLVFFIQALAATLIFVGLLREDIAKLLPFAFIPFVYLLFLRFIGEHSIFTEISGFVLLTMSALIAKVIASGTVDIRLFTAVAIFFIAGVFKVRIQFTKKILYRILVMAYACLAIAIYHFINAPFILLFPLIDNLIFSITLYKARLNFIGWLEVIKGIIFVLMVSLYYH